MATLSGTYERWRLNPVERVLRASVTLSWSSQANVTLHKPSNEETQRPKFVRTEAEIAKTHWESRICGPSLVHA